VTSVSGKVIIREAVFAAFAHWPNSPVNNIKGATQNEAKNFENQNKTFQNHN
jgi:hypothetical protein